HDPFTGLPNRRYLMDQLDRALREVRTRRRQRIAVVLIEIDRFKLINDTLGHTAGDELMLQAAQRFARAVEGIECVLSHWEGGHGWRGREPGQSRGRSAHRPRSPAVPAAVPADRRPARETRGGCREPAPVAASGRRRADTR